VEKSTKKHSCVPANQQYKTVYLKVIPEIKGTGIVLGADKARFFYANKITYDTAVSLKTVSGMLRRKSAKTTEMYVRDRLSSLTGKLRKRIKNELDD
jgi:hypothetical protein